MSYSKFTNLGEKLNGDCQGKVMKGILVINEMDRPRNCDKRLKKGNFCWWGGNGRQATVVYMNYFAKKLRNPISVKLSATSKREPWSTCTMCGK